MSHHTHLPIADLSVRGQKILDLVPFRQRSVDGAVLLSNDFGDHLFLENDQYQAVLRGDVANDDPLRAKLKANNFLVRELDREAISARLNEKYRFLRAGPSLHIFVVTLRCNHTCQYCHASRARMDQPEVDMSIETAERCVDFAFETTSPSLTIEFQGGEPLANWPIVEHIIEYARQKNALAAKSLMFALVTNLTLMDEEKLAYLIDRRVQICTSLDGPADLHDGQRIWKDGKSHDTTVDWIRRVNQHYVDAGMDPHLYHIEALPTITRQTLARGNELVEHYAKLGCRSIFLRNLDPFGWGATIKTRLGYTMPDFLEFYRKTFLHIIEMNRNGTDMVERTAALLFSKIIGNVEPNYLDIRSPCGAGIGQLAYNHDGRIFTCDEGRMVDRSGDDCFQIGNVHGNGGEGIDKDRYRDVVSSPTVRGMVLASTLEGQPGCSSCVYKPWCGVCPVHNYCEQGSIHGRMADSTYCQKHMGIFDFLMERIHMADPFELALFQRWATPRGQPHYVHEAESL
jgi:uncharacterized protein